jgi:Spy/CpxP family protein refolding chaperone
MKRIALATALLLMGLVTFAQGQGQSNRNGEGPHQNATPEERAQKMTDHMKTELSLTDAQYKEVYAVNLATAKKQAEIEKGNQEQRSAIRDQHMADLSKVLTPEQMEKAKELKPNHKGKLRQHKGGPDKPE